jgi:hypothetical protein
MLQITVFMNGATRRYFTNSFKDNYFCDEEMKAYDSALQNVDLGNTQTIKFVDITTNANVSVSPITCLIECEEVIEDGISTKKA